MIPKASIPLSSLPPQQTTMAVNSDILSFLLVRPHEPILLALILFIALRSLYRLFVHPLCSRPRPMALSHYPPSPLNFHAYNGTECTAVHYLHMEFGPWCAPARTPSTSPTARPWRPSTWKRAVSASPFYANFDIRTATRAFSAKSSPKTANTKGKGRVAAVQHGESKGRESHYLRVCG